MNQAKGMHMKPEQVQKVLDSEAGVRAESKGVYLIGEEVEVTVLLALGQEPLSIGRVKRLSITADLVTIETQKGERFYTSAQLSGLKIAQPDLNKPRGTGFAASAGR